MSFYFKTKYKASLKATQNKNADEMPNNQTRDFHDVSTDASSPPSSSAPPTSSSSPLSQASSSPSIVTSNSTDTLKSSVPLNSSTVSFSMPSSVTRVRCSYTFPEEVVTPSSVENSDSDSEKSHYPKAILVSKGKSAFRERTLNLNEPVKIGRAVGKYRPYQANAIFDCKVLSRNHALIYYEKNKFFLQDTGSSNGTFVNNVRLCGSNETSQPKEIFSGDHVQFGVDVTESTKYVTIPCISCTVKLYYPDGSEAKPAEGIALHGLNSNVKYFNLLQLTGWLQEARQREEILRNKLVTLSNILHKAQASSEQGWKAMVEEDILLSRIESLQMKLRSLLDSDINRPDEVILQLWKEVMDLQEDRERYESKAKEAIQKVLQEKLMVISKNYELQVALSSSEEQRDHYKEACDSLLDEMKKLAEDHDKQFKELQEMQEKYKSLAKSFESISNDLRLSSKIVKEAEKDNESLENGVADNCIGIHKSRMDLDVKYASDDSKADIAHFTDPSNDPLNIDDQNSTPSNVEETTLSETSTENEVVSPSHIDSSSSEAINETFTESNNLPPVHSSTSSFDISSQILNSFAFLDSFPDEESLPNHQQTDKSNVESTQAAAEDCLKEKTENYNQNEKETEITVDPSHGITDDVSLISEESSDLINDSINGSENTMFANETVLEVTVDLPVIEKDANIELVPEQQCTVTDKLVSDNIIVPNETEVEISPTTVNYIHSEPQSLCDENVTNINESSLLVDDNHSNTWETEHGISVEKKESLIQAQKIIELEKQLNAIKMEHENCQINREEAKRACDQWKKEYDKVVQANRACGDTFKFFTEKENKFKDDIAQLRTKYEHALVEISQLKALLQEYKNNNLVNSTSEERKVIKESAISESNNDESSKSPCNTEKTELEEIAIAESNNSTLISIIDEPDDSEAHNLEPEKSGEITEFSNKENINDLDKFEHEVAELRTLSEQYKADNHKLKNELSTLRNEYDLVSYQNRTASICAIVPLIILSLAIIFAYYPSFSSVTGTMES